MHIPPNKYPEMLADYLAGSETLTQTVSGLDDTQLDMSLRPDSWTIRQITHHLVDGDDVWKCFIKQAMGRPGSEFPLAWYWSIPQDEWVRHWRYAEREIGPSLSLFRAMRQHVAQLLNSNPEAWNHELTVCPPSGKRETLTVAGVIEMQTRHVAHHMSVIRDILLADNQ